MPLTSELVGHEFGRLTVRCDARWLMAYAAGVPDERPELYDTTSTLVTHPMFPVAPEWELLITNSSAPAALTRDELLRGVHASHQVILQRPISPGEQIDIRATVVGVGRRRTGATQQVLFTATDTTGDVVWRTLLTSLFLGVDLDGEPASVDLDWPAVEPSPAPADSSADAIAEQTSHVRAVDAHVYSECARIWNPIHTDVAIARSAGLADPILHGTATMARGVSIATALAGWSLSDVRGVSGDFTSMVALDSTITVRLLGSTDGRLRFEVLNDRGHPAIRNGTLRRAS